MTHLTATYLPDQPDPAPRHVDLEGMQEENLRGYFNEEQWQAIEERERSVSKSIPKTN